ncbi:MAG: cytochrome b N-terminal domain-containing protein [Blastocatellia bacterium]|nr:cytochrome b N-terminal domain-containing protein [Blastocatellia bacterium]
MNQLDPPPNGAEAMTHLIGKLYDWLDERTGIKGVLHEVLDEKIPGGARFAYVLGSALILVFGLQFVTGMFLTMYYVPSVEDAHRTVEYISKAVTSGWLIRGLHHYGSSAMIILVGLHLLQVVIWGAYKNKREVLWLVGIGLMMVVLAFSLTGYLLPWDMKAYFGTQVTVNIASEVPFLGDFIKRVMLGGTTLGTITLSRFFMVHVIILPASIMTMIALHLYLFRRAKPAGPFNLTEAAAQAKTDTFFPKQVFKDAVVGLVVFIILVVVASKWPAPLEPKANPADINYIARPEWYFLWLFQTLKYFQGPYAIIGSMVIPGVVMTVLATLPFWDRSPERHPRKRPKVIFGLFGGLAVIGILMGMAIQEDRTVFKDTFAKQHAAGEKFMAQPFKPKETGFETEKKAKAAPPAIFETRCAMCHGKAGEGNMVGPKLTAVTRSKADIVKLIENPAAVGAAKMPPMAGIPEAEREKIAEWILSLRD